MYSTLLSSSFEGIKNQDWSIYDKQWIKTSTFLKIKLILEKMGLYLRAGIFQGVKIIYKQIL